MRYYLDTEFIERGYAKIELISIGMVAEDGREFYAVARDGWKLAHTTEWLFNNVLPYLGGPWRTRLQISSDVLAFVGQDKQPEFFGYYADYDWVLFCQLFGPMVNLTKGWPKFCRDVKQICVNQGNPELPKQKSGEHNALEDARHIRVMHEFLLARARAES